MKNLFLVILALVLWLMLVPWCFVYGIPQAILAGGNQWLKQCAVGVNQSGNVFCAYFFNDIFLIRPNKIQPFGDPNLTVSHVIGKNKAQDNLRLPGRCLAALLHLIDPNHVDDAANTPQ